MMDGIWRIRKREKSEWAMLFVLLLPFSFGLLLNLIGLPSAVKYAIDIAWLILFGFLIADKFRMPNKSAHKLLTHILVFFCITVVGFLLNLQTPLYYLWGFRNNFRFFVFFFACISFLNTKTSAEFLLFLDRLYIVNFAVTVVQYFFFDIKQDYLGGLFGTGEGSNGYTMIFISIIVTKDLLLYLNHRKKTPALLAKFAMAFVIAALAELKFFFGLFVIIVLMSIFVTKFTFKKLAVAFFSLLGVSLGILLLSQLFPNWGNWFTVDSILETALSTDGYTGVGDMNRLTSLPMTWENFLTTGQKRLLGLGMGNCDTSAFSFLNTRFFQTYGHLHYNWFSSSFMFLETGIIGFGWYLAFFVLIFLCAGKRKKLKQTNSMYAQLAKIMCVVSLILILYNQSMRTEAGYMMYFILALPFIEGEDDPAALPLHAEQLQGNCRASKERS